MARWNSSLHPRDDEGKFRSKSGGRGQSGAVTLVGQGRTLRYSRKPTRGEVAVTIGSRAASGAAIGAIAGPKGSAIGAVLGGANAAAQVVVLSRRTARAAKIRR